MEILTIILIMLGIILIFKLLGFLLKTAVKLGMVFIVVYLLLKLIGI